MSCEAVSHCAMGEKEELAEIQALGAWEAKTPRMEGFLSPKAGQNISELTVSSLRHSPGRAPL